MIPNVVKGGDMRGLIRYLASEGRENEHTNPHVIGGDSHLVHWHGAEQLNAAAAGEISDYLEEPRKVFGTQMQTQVKALDPETGDKVVMGYRDQNVWHCSLSVPVDERTLSDDEWSNIASEFMDRMDFTDAGGKAPARWVAIHHGESKNGNDHIHIAASMIREDGTKWAGRYGDYREAQSACRELEAKYGLSVVAGREAELGTRGELPAERAQAEKAGMSNTAPVELGHRIRSAAAASTSEAEWIRRVRQTGVVVKPYYARGTTDVVAGYKAALKPESYNDKLVFYGGGRLGKDLSLPRIRESFGEPSIKEATEASAEWSAAAKGQRPAYTGGRDETALAPDASIKAARMLGEYNDRLASIPHTDEAAWGDVARDASGALSAWAKLDPDNSEHLNAAAEQVSRSAQVRRRGVPHRRPHAATMGITTVLLQIRTGGKGQVAGALLAKQIFTTVSALRDRQIAMHRLGEAEGLRTKALERLQKIPMTGYGNETTAPQAVTAELTSASERATAERVTMGQDGARPDGPSASPLPNPLELKKHSQHSTGRDGRDGYGR